MATIKSYQEQVQEIVSKAIDAVETQHKAFAEASFGYAEKLYKLETAKAKHDEYAGLAYGKVREANEFVASFAGDLISKYEKPVAEEKKAPAKKAPAKKPAAKKPAAKKAAPKAPAKSAEKATT